MEGAQRPANCWLGDGIQKGSVVDVRHVLLVAPPGSDTEQAVDDLRQARYETTQVESVAQASQHIDDREIHLVIVDFDCLLTRTSSQLWAPLTWQSVPVVVLVPPERLSEAMSDLHVWAQDFVRKPVICSELISRCELALERKRQQDLLYDQATRDSLTNLYNRRYFMDFLVGQVYAAVRGSGTISLVLGDVDDFKNVNDRFGHLVGDAVLGTLGEVFLENTRRSDVCGRYGGEEFAIACPLGSLADSWELTERLRRSIGKLSWQGLPAGMQVTVSFGIAQFDRVGMEHSVSALVAAADSALYEAKGKGKNRTCVYMPGATESVAVGAPPAALRPENPPKL